MPIPMSARILNAGDIGARKSQSFYSLKSLKLHVCICVCKCGCNCPQGPEEDIKCPGAVVTGGCKPQDMTAGNWTESQKCSFCSKWSPEIIWSSLPQSVGKVSVHAYVFSK